MQILSSVGNEFKKVDGMDMIPGEIVKFTLEENPLLQCWLDENRTKN